VRNGNLFGPALLRSQYFRRSSTSPAKMSDQVLPSSPNKQQIIDRRESEKVGETCEEEPLSLPAEEGYGYYPSAVVGHRLNRYKIVGKVCVSISMGWHGD